MRILLFDTERTRKGFYPFSLIRPLGDIRCGMFTLRERWEHLLQSPAEILTDGYLLYPLSERIDSFLYIDVSVVPDISVLDAIRSLKLNEGLFAEGRMVAFVSTIELEYGFKQSHCTEVQFRSYTQTIRFIDHAYQLTAISAKLVPLDFQLLTMGRSSQPISSTNQILCPERVFVEEGVVMEHCIINAADAYVYIGKGALVMEGTLIRGSFVLGENSVVKMGAKIYGTTVTGCNCILGGEIKNSVFFDYSNKAHDGYLGDSIIGSWCNLGAGTSASNVKNTGGTIKLWNPLLHEWLQAGNKCGVMLGDYSRTSVNTILNTGTVTGICCNIVNNGFPPKYISSFTWNIETKELYVLEKAFADLRNWKLMKQQSITEREQIILQYIYNVIKF
jgi:UDP-N-acetylglucosamine diphosphorylase/glucosamine-1-phosphate N-acetyltransferase